MRIEIAVDHHEAEGFCEWLNNQGHDANIGASTGNYVDGECTSNDEQANEIMNDLWDRYCREA